MRSRLGIVPLCALLLVAAAGLAHAQCAPLTPADLYLDPATTIPGNEPSALFVELSAVGSVSFPPREGAAIVAIRALPPKLLDPANEPQPGVHYSGCLDPSNGSGTLTVGFGGPLFVRVEYAGGGHDYYVVSALSDMHGDAPVCTAGYTEFATSPDALVLQSVDFASKADHMARDGQTTQQISNVNDVAEAVRNAPANTELVLDTHGSPNGIKIGSEIITDANIQALVDALGGSRAKFKLRRIKLLGCNLGKGNQKFVQDLADKTGVPVEAATQEVRPFHIVGQEATTFTHCTSGTVQTFTPGP